MANSVLLVLFLYTLAIGSHGILAVDYAVTNTAPNTAGGTRFDRDIGETYTLQAMSAATSFIWTTFQQTNPADRKDTQPVISLFVDDMDGVAYASNDQIHVSARYIEGISGI